MCYTNYVVIILKKIKRAYKESKKSSFIVYFILRFLVILCMIRQITLGHYDSAIFCVLALILLLLPLIIQKKFKINLPNILEVIIYLFIFSAEILGEIYNFYIHFQNFDLILHTLNGFLCAAIGLSLIDLLNTHVKSFKLSPLYVAIFSFCFSMTIGVLWEFGEHTMDKLFLTDAQKDTFVNTISSVDLDKSKNGKPVKVKNIDKTILYDKDGRELAVIEAGYLDIGLNDTMEDLFVNFIGASVYSILGYFYIKTRNKNNLASKFIITKDDREIS